MKTRNLWTLAASILLVTTNSFAQNAENPNPYAIFGRTPYVAGEKDTEVDAEKVFVIENFAKGSKVARIEHQPQTGTIKLFDKDGVLLAIRRLLDNEKAWPTQDKKAEKYYSISPYAFCAGNPIRYIDPDGQDVWEINQQGEIINRIKDKTQDAFHMVQQVDGQWQRMEGQSIAFEYGTVISQNTYTYSPDGQTVGSYDVFQVRGDNNGAALFEFMGNNVTGSPSEVEVGQIMTGIEGDKGLNFITTSHTAKMEQGMGNLIMGQVGYGYTVREINHSHPNNPYPSGISNQTGDIRSASILTNAYRAAGQNVPNFNIYHVPSGQKIPYGPYSQPAHFNRYRR